MNAKTFYKTRYYRQIKLAVNVYAIGELSKTFSNIKLGLRYSATFNIVLNYKGCYYSTDTKYMLEDLVNEFLFTKFNGLFDYNYKIVRLFQLMLALKIE